MWILFKMGIAIKLFWSKFWRLDTHKHPDTHPSGSHTAGYSSSGGAFSCKCVVTAPWSCSHISHQVPCSVIAQCRLFKHVFVQDAAFCRNNMPGCHWKILTDVSNVQSVARLWCFWIELEGAKYVLSVCSKRLYRQSKINTIFTAKSLFVTWCSWSRICKMVSMWLVISNY